MCAPNEIKYKLAPTTTAIIIAHDVATRQGFATTAAAANASPKPGERGASGDNFTDSQLDADEIAGAGCWLENFTGALVHSLQVMCYASERAASDDAAGVGDMDSHHRCLTQTMLFNTIASFMDWCMQQAVDDVESDSESQFVSVMFRW